MPNVHPSGSDKLRAVVVGCGRRGTGSAVDFLRNPNTEIVALADAFEENVKAAAEMLKVPLERCFWGFDAYRKALAVDCEYAILATPPGFRPIHYRAAVEMGRNVFMEKPCCVDVHGYQILMETNKIAAEKNLKVGVGLQRHHEVAYLKGIQEIADGKYGDIYLMRVYWNGGWTRVHERQPEWSEMEYQMRNWYYFQWTCGDHICEQHVHNLDVANWVKTVQEGKTPGPDYCHPVEANAMGGRQVRKLDPNWGQIFDHHFVEFTYADGTKLYSQARQQPNTWPQVAEFVHGTKGSGNVPSRPGRKPGENDVYDWKAMAKSSDGPFPQEHKDLVTAIREDLPYHEGWHGAISSLTGILGRTASYTGKVVKWDDLFVDPKPLMIYENHDALTMQSPAPVQLQENGFYPIPIPGVN
ncbi:MAG: Gfo/Idh/MocA family oxidoreductase [Thermoguttaceae bacterium]|nr:Gfo/Idh/MocA family oxidoreductase [Thermoguttaceae bacterium]